MLLLAAAARLGWVQRTSRADIGRLGWLQLGAMGIFVAGTTLTLFYAFERTSIALALIVFYTFPIMVAVAAVPLYGEHLGPRRLAAIGLATLGLVLVVLTPGSAGSGLGLEPLGVLLALGAACFQAAYALVAARGFTAVPPLQAATLMRGFALVFYMVIVVPVVALVGEGASLVDALVSAEAWVLVLVAGIVGAALPTAFLVAGYRRVGPTRGAVLMLVEPVTGVVLAAWLLAEQPGPLQLVGGLLVLTGAALVQLTARRPSISRTAVAVE